MTVRNILVGTLGVALLSLFAWVAVPAAPLAKEPQLHGQGRLWQVTRNGAEPSHVFGTMHASDPDIVDLPAPIRRAIVTSERIVLEVVFGQEMKGRMALSMLLTDGRLLEQIIGDRLFAAVGEAGLRYGMPSVQLNRLKPWAVMLVFAVPPREILRQAEGAPVLDEILQNYAQDNGLPVFGLEDPGEQIGVFAGMSERDQIKLLATSVQLNRSIDKVFAKMKNAYLKGDLDQLHAMASDLSAGDDKRLNDLYLKRLLDDRNRNMADRLVPHLDRGRTFVAVGALHLAGKRGLLHLLEKKGYTVKRVM